MDLPSDQAPVHPIGTHDIGDNASANDTFDLKQEAIPKIEVRSSTFHETSTAVADAHSNISPAPSSPGLTACETSSNISVEDGKELEHLSDQQRQQMIAEVFTQLDQLVGLTQVKDQFLEIKRTIETYQKQNVNLKHERSHIKFLGNPGTGKTTIGRMYAKLLLAMGVLEYPHFVETSGAVLVSEGLIQVIKLLHSGVVFIDEAYQLVAPHQPGGRQLMDHIHRNMEHHRGNLVLIFAGYKKDMEAFVEHNSGLSSRIPDTIYFDDFNADELLTILKRKINEKYGDRMQIQAHPDDENESRYLRIAANRLSRGRGIRGFGNARSVENQLQRISKRQIQRLDSLPEEKRDYFMLTREDIIGPHPSEAKFKSEAWTELQSMIGLEALKAQCRTMIGLSETNYERELKGLDPEMLSFNGIFMGSPGTGKTTVAGLYGRVLADLGLLSNGDVVIKTPSDFVGETLGSSEARTKTILASTIGKVLIIDEAYALGSSTGGSSNGGSANSQDNFRAGVIDTIVGEVHGAPGEDRCILLLGYEDKLHDMFQRSNPGLSSRFNYSSPFRFDDFTLDQLMEILDHKMGRQHLKATPEALGTARDVLERARLNAEYGNARAVESCLQAAKKRHQARLQAIPAAERDYAGQLEPVDFDPDFTIKAAGFTDCEQLFDGKISKSAIKQITRLQKQALMAKWTGTHNFRDIVPTNFIFRGPPGTGKTTAARLMGQLYYNLGFLAANEVVEVSVRDFIAPYVGQTRQKTKDQLGRAVGKLMIIDNAFQLLKGSFEVEALQEIINCLQSENYARKMIIILVGHTDEMKMLLQACPPLASLFPHEVKFSKLKAKDCMKLLDSELQKIKVSAPFIRDTACDDYQPLERLVHALAIGPMFANAKDIECLAQAMKTAVFDDFYKKNKALFTGSRSQKIPDIFEMSRAQASDCVKRLIKQRKCMKHLPSLALHPEIEYSDDDPRFARAFAYESMPVMEIRIEQAVAVLPQAGLPYDEADMLEDTLGIEQPSRPQLPIIGATIVFNPGLPASSFPMIHTAEALQYVKPPQETDHVHGRIEELDDESDEEHQDSAPAKSPATSEPESNAVSKQDHATSSTTPSGSEAVVAPTALQTPESKDAQFQKASLKENSAMDRQERRRYRDMLKEKYPFDEPVSERTQRALHDLGYCPQGFAWRRDFGRHICEGGCHYGYDFDVRDHMYREDIVTLYKKTT